MASKAFGIGAFGAGLAKSLAGAYAGKREREREETRRKEDRAYEVEKFKFQTMLPSMLENIEDVDDEVLASEFPTIFGGRSGKGATSKARGAITAALSQAGQAGTFTDLDSGQVIGQIPTAAAGAPAATPVTPSPAGKVVMSDLDTGAAIGEAPAVPRRTLMGVPILTAEEKIERGIGKMETEAAAKAALARRLHEQGAYPTLQAAQAAVGISLPPASATPQGFTLGPGQVRFGPEGTELARGPAARPQARAEDDFDTFLGTYAQERGKTIDRLSTAERLDARQKYAAAGRAPTAAEAGAPDQNALARMAARNPSMLQGLTPTVTGAVLAQIAKDPQLRVQYEQTRMQPIREQTQTMLSAIDSLLQVDPKTGELVIDPTTGQLAGLSSGARALFGAYTPAGLRGFIPTGEAADANAALQQVIGQQIVDLIAEMKAQSRTGATGFGQLNVQELNVLTSAATQLKQRITEERALVQLTTLRDKLRKILQPGAGELPSGGGIVAPEGAGQGVTGSPRRLVQDAKGNWVEP